MLQEQSQNYRCVITAGRRSFTDNIKKNFVREKNCFQVNTHKLIKDQHFITTHCFSFSYYRCCDNSVHSEPVAVVQILGKHWLRTLISEWNTVLYWIWFIVKMLICAISCRSVNGEICNSVVINIV